MITRARAEARALYREARTSSALGKLSSIFSNPQLELSARAISVRERALLLIQLRGGLYNRAESLR